MDARFLDLYDRELGYLREVGSEFAHKYPKLAGRLGLDEFSCSDPFVERLLEGFAFMSARVQRRMDSEFPQFVRALCDTIYPHYTRPIPSMGVFQLEAVKDEGSLATGYTVPKGTRLEANPAPNEQTGVRFDTTSDMTLWPIEICGAEVLSREAASPFVLPRCVQSSDIRSVFHLTLRTTIPLNWGSIEIDRLRLHLRGGEHAFHLYESLVAHGGALAIASGASSADLKVTDWEQISKDSIVPWGFDIKDAMLPLGPRSFSGYQLLQEYFQLPEKFLFFELTNLRAHIAKQQHRELHVVIGIRQMASDFVGRIKPEHVAMHCVPAVNLFRRRADRIHVDHALEEQHLISDRSRPLDFEVWGIEELSAYRAGSSVDRPIMPLYHPSQRNPDSEMGGLYYSLERRPRMVSEQSMDRQRTKYVGSEVYLNLTGDTKAIRESVHQIGSIQWCTQRDLAMLPPVGGWQYAFTADSAGPVERIRCLTGPTTPRGPMMSEDGEAAWRLISHLSSNYLSLSDGVNGGASMLRDMLRLYCDPQNIGAAKQVEGIASIDHTPVVRRIPLPGPIAYGRGVSVSLHCDENCFAGGCAFLLASILENYFSRHVTLNNFVELNLVSQVRGHVHRWQPKMGAISCL